MKIIIAGAGGVGSLIASQLSTERNDVTIIDSNAETLHDKENLYDVMGVVGNCATMDALSNAGVETADLLIAATSQDEINLLCCMTAHSMNPRIHTIARVMNPEYNKQMNRMRDMLALSLMVNPAKQAANEIVRILKYPGFLKRDTFAKGRVEIVELRLSADSPFTGKKLMELSKVISARVLVCAVLRGGEAVIPNGHFVLSEDDRIFVTGDSAELQKLLAEVGIVPKKTKRVIICGGGKIAFYVAESLRKLHIEVQIIEKDYERCRALVEQLDGINVINGDASVESVLEAEGLASCDALVSLSGRDELNIITSLYAKSLNVPQVITKLKYTESSSMIEKLDIGSVISPKIICASAISRYVRAVKNNTGAAASVHGIADGNAEALEFRIEGGMKHTGEPLSSLHLKKNVLICCITHGNGYELPSGKSYFVPGDTVIVVKKNDVHIEQFNDIFE